MKKILHEVMREGKVYGWAFFCPGCDSHHLYTNDGRWKFDGNMEKPTFTPSLLLTWPEGRCHLFVTNGQIAYQPDSKHELAGKTVDMIPGEFEA